ncbi:MAG: 30S ribosomal protein S6 [Candidatus Uhrbacteria bacterium]|nr:30S ribosomal protein S6 [Candidatus Uhrbacteria bacterium]
MIYEILYIVPSKFSDTEIGGVIDNVSKLLEANEAKIEKTENLGKIKLAYPINKITHGTYILVYVDVDGSVLKKIDQDFRLADFVLRHIIVKCDSIPSKTPLITAYQPPLTPEGKRTAQRKKADESKQQATPSAERMSVEELDKKLDEILDSDIVQGV